jgi:hypothetical protein
MLKNKFMKMFKSPSPELITRFNSLCLSLVLMLSVFFGNPIHAQASLTNSIQLTENGAVFVGLVADAVVEPEATAETPEAKAAAKLEAKKAKAAAKLEAKKLKEAADLEAAEAKAAEKAAKKAAKLEAKKAKEAEKEAAEEVAEDKLKETEETVVEPSTESPVESESTVTP